MTAATATKIAVHAPWVDTALSEIDMPSIPAPATKIQTMRGQCPGIGSHSMSLTQNENDREELFSGSTKELESNVVDTVDRGMVFLEYSDLVVGPCCDASDDKQHY